MQNLLDKISFYAEEDQNQRFPYDDCLQLEKEVEHKPGVIWEDFDAYLNMHWHNVTAAASWGDRIFEWNKERKIRTFDYLRLSFFERYAEYAVAIPLLEEGRLPDLQRQLVRLEKLRQAIASLLEVIMTTENETEPYDPGQIFS